MQICWNFLLKKNVSAKATHIFSAKNIRILCIKSAKTVNEMTLNELVKLMTLWTTGPRWCLTGDVYERKLVEWWTEKNLRSTCQPQWLSWMHVRPVIMRLQVRPPTQVCNVLSWRLIMKWFFRVILSLPLIQEGQLSVSGKRMCAILLFLRHHSERHFLLGVLF